MSHRSRHLLPAALTAAALLAGIVMAVPAAADPPPYEPDPTSVGTLAFYDAAGNVITGGSSEDAPFAAYTVGSAAPRGTGSGDQQAQLIFANPDPNSKPYGWYKKAVGSYTHFPLTTGPAPAQTANPTVAGDSGDLTPDEFEAIAQQSTTPGYANVIQVRLKTANSANQPTTAYDVADIQVDPTAHTWTQIYPVPANQTVPGAPTNVTATAGNASATVSWTAPTDNGGAPITGYDLERSSDGGTTYAPVTRSGTTTSQVVTGLTNGTSYVFKVAAINSVGTGAFSPPSTAVTPVAPPPPAPDATSLTVAGGRTVNYGSAVTISGVLRDTHTGKALGGQTVVLQQRPAGAKAYANLKAVKSASTGAVSLGVRPSATTAYRWSFAGGSALKASVSAGTGVSVAWVVTAAVNHANVKHGQSVDVYGATEPLKAGTKVTLQQLSGKKYVTTKYVGVVKRQKLPNGKTGYGYVIVVKLTKRGSYSFRASVAATSSLVAGVSAARTVKAS